MSRPKEACVGGGHFFTRVNFLSSTLWTELKRLKLGSTIHFSSFNWREGRMDGKWGIFHGPMEFSKKKDDLWG